MMEKLKPCPFCGGKAHLMDAGYPHWVYCTVCGARVQGMVVGEEEGPPASIRAWNRRGDAHEGLASLRKERRMWYEKMKGFLSDHINEDGTMTAYDLMEFNELQAHLERLGYMIKTLEGQLEDS